MEKVLSTPEKSEGLPPTVIHDDKLWFLATRCRPRSHPVEGQPPYRSNDLNVWVRVSTNGIAIMPFNFDKTRVRAWLWAQLDQCTFWIMDKDPAVPLDRRSIKNFMDLTDQDGARFIVKAKTVIDMRLLVEQWRNNDNSALPIDPPQYARAAHNNHEKRSADDGRETKMCAQPPVLHISAQPTVLDSEKGSADHTRELERKDSGCCTCSCVVELLLEILGECCSGCGGGC